MKQRGRRVPPAAPAADQQHLPHTDEPVERSLAAPMTPPASDQAIDLSVPRECFYRDFESDPGACPRFPSRGAGSLFGAN
jgi:hypothetical protein